VKRAYWPTQYKPK